MKWIQFSKEECEVLCVGRTHHPFSARQETTKWVEVLQKKILDLEWMTNSAWVNVIKLLHTRQISYWDMSTGT